MKITIKDRIIIQGILIPRMPIKGGYAEMIQISDLKEQLQVSMEEALKYNFRDTPDGNTIWDDVPGSDKEIKLTQQQLDFLLLAVYALDEQKLIDMDILPTCKLIMEYKIN